MTLPDTVLHELPKKQPKALKGGRKATPDVNRKKLNHKRYILTVAQNNTKVHPEFWQTLERMSKQLDARLMVGRLTYNKNGWQRVTKESDTVDGKESLWWDPKVLAYVQDEQVKLAKDLVFCGELDILPTMQFPLTGLDNYTGTNSAIIPHVKMQMRSLATMKHEDAKLLYTTGTVTLRNYIQRRQGQLAEYNHIYGALYVEVDDQGDWFVRQLNSDDNGIVYELNRAWGPTWDSPSIEFGRPLVNLGDIHIEKSSPDAMQGAMSMLVDLNPEAIFLHDLIDFTPRNHHNLKDNHFLVAQQAWNRDSVEKAMQVAGLWLAAMQNAFPDTMFYVVKSNHDEALGKWVKSGSGFPDPKNLRYWHELNAECLRNIEQGKPFDVFVYSLVKGAIDGQMPINLEKVHFVQADESVLINGIEYGMHGHYGPDGARGNPKSFRQIGRRANTGHTHSAGIVDGVWTAGVLGSLDQGYNVGPSSWSHSHIITYPNGKRTIVTQRGKKWRA